MKKYVSIANFFGPFIGLLVIIAVFTIVNPEHFLTPYNLKTVATQSAVVGIAALGMTIIIIAGGIDLSVGSVIALSTVVTALLLKGGFTPAAAGLAGILSGGICGLLNGQIIVRLRVVPFIATLGTLGIFRGLAKGLAGSQKIDAPPGWLPELLTKSPSAEWMVFSPGVWLMFILAVIAGLILSRTILGRYAYAIGSNEQAARVCGIRVEFNKTVIYTLGGFAAGLAGVLEFSRLTVGDPTVAMGSELDVIAAVVIGGGSLSGGEGSVLGTIVGTFIMAFLRNGCNLSGVPNFVQEIIIGGIIVVAVALDRLRGHNT